MNENELVSIAVISYNAERYVEETLESIKAQTYKDMELIVADDGSTDGTVDVCRRWLTENGGRFVSTRLIVGSNVGVSGNTNRALNAAKGMWFKDVASDDVLPADAIERHIEYCRRHPETEFVFGNQATFTGRFSDGNFHEEMFPFRYLYFRESVSARGQFEALTKISFGCAAASFAKTSALRRVGGYNERFPMMEDSPLYVALTKAGVKLHHQDEVTVYRRIVENSIVHSKDDDSLLNKYQVRNYTNEWYDYLAENSTPFWQLMLRIDRRMGLNIIKYGNTRHSVRALAWSCVRRVLSPFKWVMIWMMLQERVIGLVYKIGGREM